MNFKIERFFLTKNDLAHFPCCQVLSTEIEERDLTNFYENMDVLSQEFRSRSAEKYIASVQ